MKNINEIREEIRKHRSLLEERYGVSVRGIFGSYARGEENGRSDIDLLAETIKPVSLLEIVGAEIYLSDLLGRRVELVLRRNIREELRESILAEAVGI